MASGTHVRIEGVRKSYGGVAALADLDLELRPGITGLLGPNGAGKTTLIRILATLLAPSAGEVRVNGWRASDLGDRVEIRRRLGYLPQDLGLYPRFTVFEFVDYLAILKELDDPADRHRRVRAALAAVELEDLAGRKIRTLSGGMRRRVGIAQAIVADPELLLLDEPTTGLDPEQRMRFRQLIAGLGEHRTVVLSTHLVEDVAAVCTQVVVLWQGRPGSWAPLRAARAGRRPGVELPEDGRGAVSSWRTESGAYRVLGPRPSPAAEPVRRPWRTAICWSAPAPGRTRRHDRAGSPDEQAGRRRHRPSGATASAAARRRSAAPGGSGPRPGTWPGRRCCVGRGAAAAAVPGAELGLAGPGRRRPGRLPGPHGGRWRGAVGRGLAGAAGPGHRGRRPGGGHPDRAVAAAAGAAGRRRGGGRRGVRGPVRRRPGVLGRPRRPRHPRSPVAGRRDAVLGAQRLGRAGGRPAQRLAHGSVLAAPVWAAVCLFGPMVLREADMPVQRLLPALTFEERSAAFGFLPTPSGPIWGTWRARPARRRAPASPGRPGQRPAPAPGADAGGRPGRPAPGRGVRAAAGRPARPGARGRARGGRPPAGSRATTPASTPTRRSSIPPTTAPSLRRGRDPDGLRLPGLRRCAPAPAWTRWPGCWPVCPASPPGPAWCRPATSCGAPATARR